MDGSSGPSAASTRRLLPDLAQGGLLVGLAGVDLALGQAPVVVAGPVDEHHLQPAAARRRRHTAAAGRPARSVSARAAPSPVGPGHARRGHSGGLPCSTSASRRGVGPGDGQLLERLLGVEPGDRRHLVPGPVGAELPGPDVVGQLELEDLPQPGLQVRARRSGTRPRPGGPGCDPSCRPSRGSTPAVGRTSVALRAAARRPGAEVVDPRVLEPAADDAADPDVVRQPGHPGPQAADGPHDQVDPHPRLRGRVEGVDDPGVDQVVELPDDAPLLAPGRSPAAISSSIRGRSVGRGDQQPAVLDPPAVAGQEVEQVGEVGAELRARR